MVLFCLGISVRFVCKATLSASCQTALFLHSYVLLTHIHGREMWKFNDGAVNTHLFYLILFYSRAFSTQTNPASWPTSQHHSGGGK